MWNGNTCILFVYEEKDKGVEELQDNLDITYLRTNTAIGLRDFARKINDRNYEIREELGKSDKNIRRPEILDKYYGKNNSSLLNIDENNKEKVGN